MKGRITDWNDSKGFGFITVPDNKVRIFFHISALQNRTLRPQVGEKVVFDMSKDKQGRYNATRVKLLRADPVSFNVVFAAIFILTAMVCSWFFQAAKVLVLLYPVLSLLIFLLYAFDKRAAKAGKRRIAENTLHLLALLGGWPGALIAREKLRHKSQKQPFKSVLWLTILLNIGAYLWSFTPSGQQLLQQLAGLWG